MKPTRNAEVQAPPAYQVEDADLVQRLANRDETALGLLYDRFNKAVYSLALKVLKSHADSEDVVVDVFWQAWHRDEQSVYARRVHRPDRAPLTGRPG